MSRLNRRNWLGLSLAGGMAGAAGCRPSALGGRSAGNRSARKMIILGFDGMDPDILASLMASGKMPAFRKLAGEGSFMRLATSLPPQSPVAWSNFITGMDSGGHGIFDFIHRNPTDYSPVFSASRVAGAAWTLPLGKYVLPLSGGHAELLRQGRAFWQVLEDCEVPATVVQIPANFPPAATRQRTLAGMGTPDILGTYGISHFYTTRPEDRPTDAGGGRIRGVRLSDRRIDTSIAGPVNPFLRQPEETSLPLRIFVDPVHPLAKIVLPDGELLLRQGEWSPWCRLRFPLIPTVSVSGICRFFLKEVHPHFQLYASAVHLDPADPALPLSTPAGYSRELEAALGPFFTKGLPADTMALSSGLLDEAQFLAQDDQVLEESLRLFEYERQRFRSGLWFHYFSSTDQRQHMFLRFFDPSQPGYDPALAARCRQVIEDIYRRMDQVLESALQQADRNTALLVLSDHGFREFRREFHLNSWLLQNGYMKLLDPRSQEEAVSLRNTDWENTRAYALGFNGLYLNRRGREAAGIVAGGEESRELLELIRRDLESVKDPQTGEKVVRRVYAAAEAYHGPLAGGGPDLIVGYRRGYRSSAASSLGKLPKPLFTDNRDKWGGDHCMDPEEVPGILLSNRKIASPAPRLCDLTATILEYFGAPREPGMIGRSLLEN